MPNIQSFIDRICADGRYNKNIVSRHEEPAREAVYGEIPARLHPALQRLLAERGLKELWQHQTQAIEAVLDGQNVLISTGVASGKSLAYQMPVLNSILADSRSRALMIFPTKALTQDQAHKLGELCTALAKHDKTRIKSGIYDGDAPQNQRQSIRKSAQIIFTNPDMLHLGILPHHAMWSAFFSNLRYVVIDEVHYYRGVFGSHFANVLRRLLRICRVYGNKPIFICTSATLANAREFAATLLDADLLHISLDASATGEKTQIIYNPPIVEQSLGIRRSSLSESASLAKLLLKYPLQGIMFSASRKSVEMLYLRLSEKERERVSPYRGGYLADERRKIEKGLRTGELSLVISTNALELGIDIGNLDVAIINGYPGTISALRQEAGRTGRRGKISLAILVANGSPLDQYITMHPEYIWENNPEEALIDPNNTDILLKHLWCAAHELAFGENEDFGSLKAVELIGYFGILEEDGKLRKHSGRYTGILDRYPAAEVSLRSAGLQYPILYQGECLAWVDADSAHWMTHPHAIYLHGGESWIVDRLDLEKGLVNVSPFEGDYYTQARQENQIDLSKLLNAQNFEWGSKYLANVLVHSRVKSFKKLRFGSLENLGEEPLELPRRTLDTVAWYLALSRRSVENIRAKGLWNSDPLDYGKDWAEISLKIRRRDGFACVNCGIKEEAKAFHVHHIKPLRAFDSLEEANRDENLVCLCPRCHHLAEQRVRMQSGIDGLAYLLGNLAPFFVMCDPGNLGIHSELDSPLAEFRPMVLLFDNIPGGIGLSKKIYQIQDKILLAAKEQVQYCKCAEGCPACVGPVSENGVGAKMHSLAILDEILTK